MSLLDGLRHRLRVLLRGERYDHEVERELRFHTELETIAQTRDGAGAVDGELTARRVLGNATYYREEVRQMTLFAWVDRIRQDAGYALRGFGRTPGFTAAVVITLGLGIGVNGAMFSLLDRIFLQPPAGVTRPSEVRRIYLEGREYSSAWPTIAYPQLRAFRAALDSSIALGAYTTPDSTSVRDGNTRLPARRSLITNDYFTVLGIRAAAGRLFGPEEADIAVPARVAVLSDAFWRRAFDGAQSILGKRVKIQGREYAIVGVAQPGFTGVDINAVDIWVPASNYERGGGRQGQPWYNTFGASFNVLVRPGTAAAADRLLQIGTSAIQPVEMRGVVYDSTVVLRSGPIIAAAGPSNRAAEITVATRVAGVASMVLIIACANVTNLLLLRATRRRREIAVRRALGVSRMRLIEQFAVESVLLSLLGGAVAIVFSLWAGAALRRLVLPRVQWASSPLDLRTTAFVGAVALIVGLVAGLFAAVNAMKPDLAQSLRAGSREGAYRGSKLRGALLALQAALCLVLLVGSGLFLRSLDNVRSIGVGYNPDNLVVIRPQFDDVGNHDAELRVAVPEAAKRLASLSDVEAVAFTSVPPLQGAHFSGIHLPDRDSLPQLPGDYGPSETAISPGFFTASGLRLKQGRDFTGDDRRGAQYVVIVNEALARLYWPGQPAIGKCIILGPRTGPCASVIGVSADPRRMRILEGPVGQLYYPLAQSDEVPSDLVIRTRSGRETAVMRAAEQIFQPLVPGLNGLWARRLSSVLAPQLRPWTLGATLFSALALLALAVAAVGVYSVVAYGVSQRTNEMGIRIALGARARDIIDLVVRDGVRIVGVGIAVGAAAAIALGPLVASLLFGVLPRDVSILVGASALLCGVGMLACFIPGWRAARVDPATTLRMD